MSVSRLFQGSKKHMKSLSKKVCLIVVVIAPSRAEGGCVFFGWNYIILHLYFLGWYYIILHFFGQSGSSSPYKWLFPSACLSACPPVTVSFKGGWECNHYYQNGLEHFRYNKGTDKTTFDGRRPSMDDNLWWMTTFDGRRPLMEDELDFGFGLTRTE